MDTVSLAKYVVSFFHAAVPVSSHSYYEKPEITEARYESIAETIAEASAESPLFSDDTDGVKTAMILGSIATYESSLRDDVDVCKRVGDHGTAFSIFQIHSSRSKVCERRIDAARVAREMVRDSFKVCKGSELMDRLSVYTDGSCHSNWSRSRSPMFRAMDFVKKHPFKEIGE